MNPEDLLKAMPELAKGATALGAAIPFTAIAKRMLGPAADEIAEMWRDKVRLYRYRSQLACVQKAVRMAEGAGFQPGPVPPKILFPLLEGVSYEEDEDMHTMWAALLTNSTNPQTAEKVRPSFIAILKELAPDEAKLLNWLYAEVEMRNRAIPRPSTEFQFDDLSGAYRHLQNGARLGDQFVICLSNLEAADLIDKLDHKVNDEVMRRYVHTARGMAFYQACCPPAK